ncbi:MAG: hypothetical protein QMD77_04660 [Patescibacteria group bacterium]|nr:hypothetical protein [Patescibacteria group bacterium]
MHEKEYQGEGGEMEMGGGWMGCCAEHMRHWPKKMKREFKMAMLRKKEKMLEAKLAFVREMKDMVEKMPEETEEKK